MPAIEETKPLAKLLQPGHGDARVSFVLSPNLIKIIFEQFSTQRLEAVVLSRRALIPLYT
jgi:hypothetical protein